MKLEKACGRLVAKTLYPEDDEETMKSRKKRFMTIPGGIPRVTFRNGPPEKTGFFEAKNQHGDSIVLHRTQTYCYDLLPPPEISASSMTMDAKIITLSCFPVWQDKVFQIDGFMTTEECDEWIKFSDRNRFYKPPVIRNLEGFANPEASAPVDLKLREELCPIINEDFANKIWRRLHPFVPPSIAMIEPTGCSALTRVYRCSKDLVSILSTENLRIHTENFDGDLNGAYVLVFLTTEEFEGGEIILREGSIEKRIVAKSGSLIFCRPGSNSNPFYSAQVSKGTRHLLVTEINYSHIFKNSVTPRDRPNTYFYEYTREYKRN